MSKRFLLAGVVLAALAPAGAYAQGSEGAAAGAATGAVGGAIVGGLAGEQQPRFRQYVVTQDVPSYRYAEEVRVGAVLPKSGVVLHEVSAEYGVRGYRYTVVNETPVVVEPGTRRIVPVIR